MSGHSMKMRAPSSREADLAHTSNDCGADEEAYAAGRPLVNAMDEIALSLKMKRLSMWLDGRCQPAGFIQKQFEAPPFGHCYVTIDPERQGPFASSNYNPVLVWGPETGLRPDGLRHLTELFTTSG